MRGIFNLKSEVDLLRKLQHDLSRIEANPRDKNAAFDFFVTAESLLDWVLPGRANKSKRQKEQNNNVLLQVTSHLATGAKHFLPEAAHHNSVKESKKTGGTFSANTFSAWAFRARAFPKGNLIITLDGEAERELGSQISALELARKVFVFWQQRLSPSGNE